MNNAGINLMRRKKQRTSCLVAFLDCVLPCHQQHHLHRVRHINNYYTAAATTTTIRNVATTKNEAINSNINLNRSVSTIKKVAIIGGGLAGLSTAYHLLLHHNTPNNNSKEGGIHITIYDTAEVGEGGASSVAGGLLHPFSPRGKLIHNGLCALNATNDLIQAAIKYEPKCIIRSQLYRLAFDDINSCNILQETANQYPTLATWLTEENVIAILPPLVDIPDTATTTSRTTATTTSTAAVVGGIVMSNGCQVIHVPTYLKGLLCACEQMAATNTNANDSSITWKLVYNSWKNDINSMNLHLSTYDVVILSAGAGLFHNRLLPDNTSNNNNNNNEHSRVDGGDFNCLPVQLVRGQSIEMTLPTSNNTTTTRIGLDDALLCGKYVSPLPPSIEDVTTTSSNTRRYVIGATHEYQSIPLSTNEVQEELKSRTYQMAKQLWDIGSIDKITCGVRVQSTRGKYGRMPIVGRINTTTTSSSSSSASSATSATTGISHHNTWIFTGLSSRGLIYHGLFGSWLATAILHNDETKIRDKFPEFDWWREQ
jgi:glycine/D-amino acid oxidase-like deaminating enzyme